MSARTPRHGRRIGGSTGMGGRIAGIPFVLVLLVVLGLGMAGVLVLNTQIQQQEEQLETLQTQAQAASYHQAALQGEVDQLGTTDALAAKAANLGMVPNPNPVIIVMPSGLVHGTPSPAAGTELPGVAVPSAVSTPSSQISIVASGNDTAGSAAPTVSNTASATPSASTPSAAPSPTGSR